MGIFAKNREEWAVTALACMRSSITIVPFYDSLGPEALNFVLNQTEVQTMCVDSNSLKTLLKAAPNSRFLRNIVTFDDPDENQMKQAAELNIRILKYSDVIAEGS